MVNISTFKVTGVDLYPGAQPFSGEFSSVGGIAPGPASFDPALFIFALLPFILFMLLLPWGLRKKSRRQKVRESAYNLIAIQLLFFLFLPVCSQPFDCAFWAVVPLAMFLFYGMFAYHWFSKEMEHQLRVLKVLEENYVKEVGSAEEKIVKEVSKIADSFSSSSGEAEEEKHKKMERLVHRVITKNQKGSAPKKKRKIRPKKS